MKKAIFPLLVLLVLLVGCSTETSYFSNFTAETSDTAYNVYGTLHKQADDNAIVAQLEVEEATAIRVTGSIKAKNKNIQLIYRALDGTETAITADKQGEIDMTLGFSSGSGSFRFTGGSGTCDFEFQFEAAPGVSYSVKK